jgi:hypothetical protein
MRELYQRPMIREVIHMDHIKGHYFSSHPTLNTYRFPLSYPLLSLPLTVLSSLVCSIVPVGPDTLQTLLEAHDRDRFR